MNERNQTKLTCRPDIVQDCDRLTLQTMFNLGYGRSSENGLSAIPLLLHGTRYRMNFDKHRLSTASNATSRLIFFALLLGFS